MAGAASPSRLATIGDAIQLVSNTAALPIGTIGNIITILVMARPHMRTSSAAVYFAVVAFFDLCVLYASIPSDLVGWNRFGTGNSYSALTCKLSIFVLRLSATVSKYTLLALTIDRLIAVRYPLKSKTICTACRALKVCVCIVVVSAIFSGHVFWTRGDQEVEGVNGTSVTINCGYTSSGAQYFLTEINNWIHFVVSCYVPVLSSIILNGFILHGLRTRDKLLGNLVSDTQASMSRAQTRSMSIMLVTASIMQIILITPNFIVLGVVPLVMGMSTPHGISVFLFARKVTVCMAVQNHSLNFFVYVASGSRFRKELMEMFTLRSCRSSSKRTASRNTQNVERGDRFDGVENAGLSNELVTSVTDSSNALKTQSSLVEGHI